MESSGTTLAADQAVAVSRIITSHPFLRAAVVGVEKWEKRNAGPNHNPI